MKKVKLIGPGLKLNNSWHFIGDIVEISEEEYEANKEYLELLEDLEEGEHDNKNDKNPEGNKGSEGDKGLEGDKDPEGDKNPEGNNEDDDEEMELLKEKAKKLGINPGKMKKETLLKKIEAAESQNK